MFLSPFSDGAVYTRLRFPQQGNFRFYLCFLPFVSACISFLFLGLSEMGFDFSMVSEGIRWTEMLELVPQDKRKLRHGQTQIGFFYEI